jgi:hypothetical protein
MKYSIRGSWSFAVASLAATMTLGCSSSDKNASPETSSDEVANLQENLVLEVAYSDTGKLSIYEDADGNLGVTMSGRIGADDPEEIGRAVQPSLISTIQALNPGAEIPAWLPSLDERFQARVSELAASNDLAGGSVEENTQETKDAITFIDNVCKQHSITNGSTFKTVVNHCKYRTGVTTINTSATYDAGDFAFAWNEGNQGAYVWASGTGISGYYTVNAYTWQWNYWSTGGSNQTVYVFYHNNTYYSNLGVSHHDTVSAWP